MREMEGEVGVTVWSGKLLVERLKKNLLLFICCQHAITRHDRPLKTGGFDGNEISLSGVLCPASGLSDLSQRPRAGTPENDSDSRAGLTTEGQEKSEDKMSERRER